MKKHNPLGLTPEELAELEAFDAEVDQDNQLTTAELAESRRLDREYSPSHNTYKAKKQREYNRRHKEERRAQARKDYWSNPEKHREAGRRWYARHGQQKREYARAYYQEHKDEYLAQEHARQAIWEPYGQRIRAAREARGWTQKELGARLGLSHGQTVAKYETGRRQIDWERFRAVLPEIGPQPEGYPARNAHIGRPRQWNEEGQI